MSSLFASLINSADALSVFQRALTVIQNNVSNAETPGYAKQRQTITALPFDPAMGLPGGIAAGEMESARDQYAEETVRRQRELYGRYEQMASDLVRIEPFFDATGDAGIPGAMNQFFQAVSAWSVNPNDTVGRQQVLNRAGTLAQSVRETASGLSEASSAVGQQIRSTVDQINFLASRLRDLNQVSRRDFRGGSDAAIDAQVHTTLEQLSELVDFKALRQDDGSYTILLAGQVPLVVGDHQYEIQADSTDPQQVRITSPQSGVVEAAPIQGGRLSALLEMKNQTIPSFASDLNRLAKAVADTTNGVLAGGVDSTGQPGAPLFSYGAEDGSDAAATLALTAITPAQLAGALQDAPGGNGNVLNLAALANQPLEELDNFNFSGFYGRLTTEVGQQVSKATENRQSQEQLLIQAQSLRSDISGVSLDEEAARLIEFQRAYQASARLLTVLNDLTQTTIDLLQ